MNMSRGRVWIGPSGFAYPEWRGNFYPRDLPANRWLQHAAERFDSIELNGTFVEYDHPTEGHVKTPGFPIKFSKTPSTVERGAPLAGQHTREILKAAGYDDARIDALMKSGALAETKI